MHHTLIQVLNADKKQTPYTVLGTGLRRNKQDQQTENRLTTSLHDTTKQRQHWALCGATE